MTHPRRPRSTAGQRAEIDPVRSFRLSEQRWQQLDAKARQQQPARTMSDITRALIEGWTEGEIEIGTLYRPAGGAPVRSVRIDEAEWQSFSARCTERGITRSWVAISLLIGWQAGEFEITWLGDAVGVGT